jgi:hypothetical protein
MRSPGCEHDNPAGTSPDPLAWRALAGALNSQEFRLAGAVTAVQLPAFRQARVRGQEFRLAGAVTAVDVVRYESGRVDTITQLPLR